MTKLRKVIVLHTNDLKKLAHKIRVQIRNTVLIFPTIFFSDVEKSNSTFNGIFLIPLVLWMPISEHVLMLPVGEASAGVGTQAKRR